MNVQPKSFPLDYCKYSHVCFSFTRCLCRWTGKIVSAHPFCFTQEIPGILIFTYSLASQTDLFGDLWGNSSFHKISSVSYIQHNVSVYNLSFSVFYEALRLFPPVSIHWLDSPVSPLIQTSSRWSIHQNTVRRIHSSLLQMSTARVSRSPSPKGLMSTFICLAYTIIVRRVLRSRIISWLFQIHSPILEEPTRFQSRSVPGRKLAARFFSLF